MLTQPGATRFGTVMPGCSSAMKNREAIEKTLIAIETREFVDKNKYTRSAVTGQRLDLRYQEIKAIVNDDQF
eukprot:scaffold383182_cov15-Prasinocladus_malaysianus.AAC.1